MHELRIKKGLAIIDPETNQPMMVTYAYIRTFLFIALYQPIRLSPTAAEILNALYRGDEMALPLRHCHLALVYAMPI
jgi:hypothetical protein